MKLRVVLAVAALFTLAAASAADPVKSDQAALQGTWRLFSVEINKEPIPLEDLKEGDKVMPVTLVVKGDSYVCHLGKQSLDLTFKMDPGKTPKTIDMTFVSGPEKDKVLHGIYKLDADTYTVCRHVDPDQPRPTVFETKKDSGLMLVVWKRAGPAIP
jgi:uncharacterized protein (TIGR03067 family)